MEFDGERGREREGQNRVSTDEKTAKLKEILQDYAKLKRKALLLKQVYLRIEEKVKGKRPFYFVVRQDTR
jgi:hypothetical protein